MQLFKGDYLNGVNGFVTPDVYTAIEYVGDQGEVRARLVPAASLADTELKWRGFHATGLRPSVRPAPHDAHRHDRRRGCLEPQDPGEWSDGSVRDP